MATKTLNIDGETFNNTSTYESDVAGTSAVGIDADNVTFVNEAGGIVRAIQDEGIQARGENTTIVNQIGGILESPSTSEPIIDAAASANIMTVQNFGSLRGRVLLTNGDDNFLQAGTWVVPLNGDGTVAGAFTTVGLAAGDDQMTLDYATLDIDFQDNAESFATTRIGIFGGTGEDTLTIDNLDGTFAYFNVGEFEALQLSATDGAVTTTLDGAASDFGDISSVEINANVSAILSSVAFTGIDIAGDAGANGLSLTGTTAIGDVTFGGGNDTFNAAAGTTHGDVRGGAGNDTLTSLTGSGGILFGEAGEDTLVGGASDDILNGGADADILTGGSGADIFRGSAASFDGDTITDLAAADRLELTGVAYLREVAGTEDVEIVTNTTNATFTVGSDLSASGFISTGQAGGNTLSQIIADLADLVEGTALSSDAINGIAVEDYLSSDTATDFTVTLRAADIGADFDNSLGVYEIRGDGSIGDVRLLAPNVKDGGTFTVEDLDAGSTLGFFIVQDGADALSAGDVLDIDVSGGTAALEVDGVVDAGLTIFLSHDVTLNPDNAEHVTSGAAEDGSGALAMGFEDLLRSGGSDDDFQDVVFQVEAILPPDAVV